MSRLITGIRVELDTEDLQVLWSRANLEALRVRTRSDERLQRVLKLVYMGAAGVATLGQVSTDTSATREAGTNWTVTEIAREAGVSPRTVRREIERGFLSADATSAGWIIGPEEADLYFRARSKKV
ncbi:hypothetical protein [Microbacterium sp. E-13]|uniref:hypothetical protein n=1 Tax=Microbacterium sp. E-13 TaxID=3404048 RepID=UPI003CED44FA